MGLLDKIKAKMAAAALDTGALIREGLAGQEELQAHALGWPAGADTDKGHSGQVMTAFVNTASEVVSKKRHIGGEKGTIARSLPTTGEARELALTDHGVSVWDFGMYRNTPATAPEYRIAREHIASLAGTGRRSRAAASSGT